MAPRIPAQKPRGDIDLLDLLWEHFFGNIPILGDLLDMFDGTYSGGGVGAAITSFFDIFKGRVTDIEDVQVPRLDNRIDELSGIGTRSTFYINGTFPDPGPGKTIGVAVFNGGNGQTGAKYVFQEFISDELTFPISVTVGGPGAASSFGSHLAGSWVQGGVVTAQGIFSANNDAGGGGSRALTSNTGFGAGFSGGTTFYAAGGAGGASGANDGGNGADAPMDKITVVGGGGGGGGGKGATALGQAAGGDGGNGGHPGGGAGQGGGAGALTADNGTPATGVVVVTVK